MTDKLKLFSQEWCDAALDAVNANDAVYEGFKDLKGPPHDYC